MANRIGSDSQMYIPVGPGFFDQLKSQPMRPIPLKPSTESEKGVAFATLMTKKITRLESFNKESALELKLNRAMSGN
jgi:hypothetical protein